MEKLGLDLDDGSSPNDQKQANPQEVRELSIQCCVQSLVHACQCRVANCRLPSCQKIALVVKRVVQHTKVCKRKTNGGCPISNKLIALCCYHAKHCQETECPVPFCTNIKRSVRQRLLQQRLHQAQLLRRRMEVMITTRNATMQPTNAVPGSNVPALTPGAQSVVPGAASSASSMDTNVMFSTGMSMPSPHQPGSGIKPGIQTPSTNILQVAKQVQEDAARQQQPQENYGKLNPKTGVPGQNMPPPQVQRTGRLATGQEGNLLPMEQWQQRYPGEAGQELRQAGPQLMEQPAAQLGAGSMQGGTPTVRPGAPAIANPVNTMMHKQALQQLIQTLRSPQSPNQNQ